jgi:hypothetical protein
VRWVFVLQSVATPAVPPGKEIFRAALGALIAPVRA